MTELPACLGTVDEAGRGSLPYTLLGDDPLVAWASRAMGEAGITVVDASVPWASIRSAGEPFVLHDPLCPLTPAEFLARCVRRAVDQDVVVVGVRPVTDTIKAVSAAEGDLIVGETVDRDSLWAVVSPVVLPARVCALLVDPPQGRGFGPLVAALAQTEIGWEEAPPLARRVDSADDVLLLAALTG